MEKKRIVFVHIPKTAGSTFNSILFNLYEPRDRFHVYAGSVASAKRYYEITTEIVQNLDIRIVAGVSLIHGHMPFLDLEKLKDFRYVTFLRDPIARVMSDYLFIKSTPQNPLFHIVNSLNLESYVRQCADLHLDNLQTRILAGKMTEALQRHDVDIAKNRASRSFAAVGFTEYFEVSLIQFRDELQWDKIPRFSNQNIGKVAKSRISGRDIQTIKEYNRFDIELYSSMLQGFHEITNSKDAYFKSEVLKLRTLNDGIGKVSSLKRILGFKSR